MPAVADYLNPDLPTGLVRVAMRVIDGLSFAAPAGKKVAPVVPRELLGTPEQFIARLRSANAAGGKR